MSFTFDGIEIATEPVTLVRLACDSSEIMSGHSVSTGEFVFCTECTKEVFGGVAEIAEISDKVVTCQVTDVFRIEMVPTVHIA